ncbi:MAG: DUF805 domain-containing protein [Myxococcota bacterium]|nr:DUF805 domain-containing protein [Myxococcota bacterium]
MFKRLLSLQGRIGQLEFFLAWTGAPGFFVVLFSLLFSLSPRSALEPIVVITFGFGLLLVAYLQFAATLKRLHDFDHPKDWYHWIVLLPFQPVALIFVLMPGDPEINRFGFPPGPLFGDAKR